MEEPWAHALAGLAVSDDPKKFLAQNIKRNMLMALCMTARNAARLPQIENTNFVKTSELYQEMWPELGGAGGGTEFWLKAWTPRANELEWEILSDTLNFPWDDGCLIVAPGRTPGVLRDL